MAGNWSRFECEIIVEDYLNMLAAECRQERYSKAEHRRLVMPKLSNRSEGSIEFKHQNISAVLIENGHVYIRGYKPAWNYQELLETVVLDRITLENNSIQEIEGALIDQVGAEIIVENTDSILVSPPERLAAKPSVYDRAKRAGRKIDYSAREARNRR